MLKTVSTANGLVSPTFSGNVTLSDGNLVIGTSGKGIDFSATPGTGTSELLADYEEGTYTPTLVPSTSGTITLSASGGLNTLAYTKIGRLVTVTGLLSVDSSSSPVGTYVTLSLPFSITGSGFTGRTVADVITRLGGINESLIGLGIEGTSGVIAYIDASTVVSTRQFSINVSFITA
jgi:hypothetical protein